MFKCGSDTLCEDIIINSSFNRVERWWAHAALIYISMLYRLNLVYFADTDTTLDMPLLGAGRFKCQPIPENLDPEDEVYVCKATGEVFTDYEKFFDQTILCNSLIWTCEVTGHTGMTFSEALESEINSRKQLETFPPTLQLPILHLASLTRRTIFKDLLDDIFGFVKDRYFIGENVTVTMGTEKKNAVVIKVFPMANNFNHPLGDTGIGNNVEGESLKKSIKRRCSADSSSFQYMSQDQNTGIAIMSNSKNMSRNKNLFNRDSCKLFLKGHCEHKGKGIWKLKESVVKKYNLSNVKFSDYFAGPMPTFPGIEAQKAFDCEGLDKKGPNQKKKDGESVKDWLKPRDDLLCDDLKDLPMAIPVMLFNNNFGSAVTVMEFLSCFGQFCGIELPDNFSISELDNCLKEQESNSFFLDLIQNLLLAIFQMQLGIPEIHQAWKLASKDQSDADLQFCLSLTKYFQSVEKKSKSQKYHSIQDTPLRQLPIDSSSLTEVLRLHLLIGYSEASTQTEFASEIKIEHNASEFSRTNPEIMRNLMIGNVLDLDSDEKLKLLNALIDQVLSLPACRDYIEERYNRLKSSQKDLRTHIWAVQRRERDLLNYNFKKRQEEETVAGGKIKENVSKGHDTIVTRAKKKSILDLKDKDFEEMPMEGIDWDQLTQEEKDHIKNWSEKRQLELQTAVEAAQTECCLTPIGMDRTYRRYWIFKSVPGLFVEDSKIQDFTIPSSCLSLVPQDPNKVKNSNMRRDFKGDLLEEPEHNDRKSLICVNAHEQLASRGKTEWSLFSSIEELESLIENLNTRGHRENHLKNCLIRSKQKIIKSMTLCEVDSLTKVEENVKQNDTCCFNFVRNMKGELELTRTIADLLLDLEERIFAGSLGQLKISNREEWRKALETLYPDCNTNEILDFTEKNDMAILTTFRSLLSKCLIEVMEMVDIKYLSAPLGENEDTRHKRLRVEIQQQIAECADKIEDVEASNSQESFQSSVANNHVPSHKADSSKWKELVHRCSSASQLYLCLVLLDSSIAWSRSALNARCKVCRKKKDGENMLLCDGCDQGLHMYCLRPPLKKIPEGDWFCPSCQPKNLMMISPRKSIKSMQYKDYDSDFCGDDDEESLSSNEPALNGESMNDWRNDLLAKRNHKRKCREIASKKINGSNVTKSRETSTANRSQADNLPPSGSPTLHDIPEGVKFIPVTSHPIKSRSGREIVRPKGNEQFVEEEFPVAKAKKREKYNNDDDLYVPRIKRRCVKNAKYGDDFDYDNEDEGEEYEEFDEDEYASRSLKKKRGLHSDEGNIHSQRSKRSSAMVSKHSQRKTNASMKAIEDLVTDLMKNDNAWPFLKPVTLKQAPDYFDIVEKPIDLSTIKYKIYRFEYEDQNQIIDDLRLMLYNCNLYNCPNTPVHDAGMALEAYLDKRLEEIDKNSISTGLNSSSHRKRTSV